MINYGLKVKAIFFILFLTIISNEIKNTSFISPVHFELENFIKKENYQSKSIYSDGVMPFFIQRNIISNNKYFYDINSRIADNKDVENFCKIKICINPDVWIISDYEKDAEFFLSIKKYFSGITYSDEHYYVANQLILSCTREDANECSKLEMFKR